MTYPESHTEKSGGNLWVVTSCMGRLSFLQHTAPRVLAKSYVHYCLVDYSCPDNCGEWVSGSFRNDIARHRCVIEHVPYQSLFNKCKAYNTGAQRAIDEGARYLCFLDADTIVEPGLFDWLLPQLASGHFFIAALQPDGRDVRGLTGMLVVSAADFARSAGFDESFRGWGSEDIEMRLRLHVLHNLSYVDVPLDFMRPIEHGDPLRVHNYQDKDLRQSDQQNFVRLVRKLHVWRNEGRLERSSAARLFYQSPRRHATMDGQER